MILLVVGVAVELGGGEGMLHLMLLLMVFLLLAGVVVGVEVVGKECTGGGGGGEGGGGGGGGCKETSPACLVARMGELPPKTGSFQD